MRQDAERQKKLEPKRIAFAKKSIENLGYKITYQDETKLKFEFKAENVTLFPYSGWHAGKSIKDGRGVDKLLKQLK